MHRGPIALVVCAVAPAFGQDTELPRLDAEVETVLRVTESRFQASNMEPVERLLLFTDASGLLATAHLPAGGELSFSFPSGTTAGIQVEVLSLDPAGFRRGVAVDLTVADDSGLWIETSPTLTTTWRETPNGLVQGTAWATPSGGSLWLPPAPAQMQAEAVHVPVPTPGDPEKRDVPPEVDEKPLPPV